MLPPWDATRRSCCAIKIVDLPRVSVLVSAGLETKKFIRLVIMIKPKNYPKYDFLIAVYKVVPST